MDDGHTKNNDRFLLVSLAVLFIITIGLIVGLVIITKSKQDDNGFDGNVQEGAAKISDAIEQEVAKGDEIDMTKADELYTQEIAKYSGDDKLALVMKYVAFVYNNELDAYRALGILKTYESNVTEGVTSGLYYKLMSSLYRVVGDEGNEAYYDNLSKKVWPEGSENNEQKEDEEE